MIFFSDMDGKTLKNVQTHLTQVNEQIRLAEKAIKKTYQDKIEEEIKRVQEYGKKYITMMKEGYVDAGIKDLQKELEDQLFFEVRVEKNIPSIVSIETLFNIEDYELKATRTLMNGRDYLNCEISTSNILSFLHVSNIVITRDGYKKLKLNEDKIQYKIKEEENSSLLTFQVPLCKKLEVHLNEEEIKGSPFNLGEAQLLTSKNIKQPCGGCYVEETEEIVVIDKEAAKVFEASKFEFKRNIEGVEVPRDAAAMKKLVAIVTKCGLHVFDAKDYKNQIYYEKGEFHGITSDGRNFYSINFIMGQFYLFKLYPEQDNFKSEREPIKGLYNIKKVRYLYHDQDSEILYGSDLTNNKIVSISIKTKKILKIADAANPCGIVKYGENILVAEKKKHKCSVFDTSFKKISDLFEICHPTKIFLLNNNLYAFFLTSDICPQGGLIKKPIFIGLNESGDI